MFSDIYCGMDEFAFKCLLRYNTVSHLQIPAFASAKYIFQAEGNAVNQTLLKKVEYQRNTSVLC